MVIFLRRESLEPFIGKEVKLVLGNNFLLYGTIDSIDEPWINFTTSQKTSLIHWDRIQEVTPV